MNKKAFISEITRMKKLAGIIKEDVQIGPGGSMSGFEEPKSSKYEKIEYDVWGNADDGYEVNQAFHTGRFVYIPDDLMDSNDLFTLLQKDGLIHHKAKREDIEIDLSHEEVIYFSWTADNKPLFELSKVEQ